jgi:acyl-CoA thioesterase-1
MSRLRIARRPLSALAVLAAQLAWAGHRPDLPTLTNQDTSGVFGDPEAPRLRIVVLGDSTVTSPGVEPLDAAWPRRLAREIAGSRFIELHCIGVGGSKAHHVLANQVDQAISLQPDICIVSVGGNDALRGTPVARFERDYGAILERLTRHVPYVAVSGVGDLGSIPRLPMAARTVARIRARSFDRAIRRAAYPYPQVVKTDTWSPGWNEFNTNPQAIFGADEFHASAYGHRVYAAAMLPAVEELLSRREADTQRESG